MVAVEEADEWLTAGLKLMEWAPDNCQGCTHALRAACTVARLVIENGTDPEEVGSSFNYSLFVHCRQAGSDTGEPATSCTFDDDNNGVTPVTTATRVIVHDPAEDCDRIPNMNSILSSE